MGCCGQGESDGRDGVSYGGSVRGEKDEKSIETISPDIKEF